MKLTETEAAVLAAVRLNADESVPAIAKALRLKESSVRHTVSRLRERGIIHRFAMINISTLGYTEYDITCGLALRGTAERKKFFEYLNQSEQVSQVLETGGIYQCLFTVCAKTPGEVDAYLQKIGAKFGPIFINTNIGVSLRYANFPPKYLAPGKKLPRDFVSIPTLTTNPNIDDVDRKILQALSKNREASGRDLARVLGMPVTTVHYRLNALEKNGALVGYLNQIEPKGFEHEAFLIYLSFRTITSELRNALFEFGKSHPHVTYMLEWLGYWQCAFGVVAPDAGVASTVSNQIYDQFGHALHESTLFPIIHDHKMDFFPFN